MRSREFVTEKKNRRKRKVKAAAYGPGPYGWYGYNSGYGGDEGDGGSGDGGGLAESLDQPYALQWSKGDYGDVDALAKLPDGTYLTIMFERPEGPKSNLWHVQFDRDNSQEITGKGDAQRIFATVLSAIKVFVKKRRPRMVYFSAVKSLDFKRTRTRLYDRLVQHYATQLGYKIIREEHIDSTEYYLIRQDKTNEQGVSEDLSDDLGYIYAMHPQPEQSEQIAFRIFKDSEDPTENPQPMDEDEFSSRWTALPDPYQEEFGYDLPLWDANDLSGYPNLVQKRITFDQYVKLVGDYIKSEELARSSMSKMKKGVAEGSLNEFAPSGGEGNGPMDYGRAIIEIGEEFIDYYTDEGSGSDAAKIIEVGNTFIAKGMAAGINAFYTILDTQVRDHVAEQLMDQGFNVRQDIYKPFRDIQDRERAERDKEWKSSPQYQTYLSKQVKISAIPDKPIDSWSKPGESAAEVTFDMHPKRDIKAEFAEFKQSIEQRPSLKGVNLRYEITIGGQPIDINQLNEQNVSEAWSEKYKKSINCSRPRGFSQRAHCQGRKKK